MARQLVLLSHHCLLLIHYPALLQFQGEFLSELVEKGFSARSGPSSQLVAGALQNTTLIKLISQSRGYLDAARRRWVGGIDFRSLNTQGETALIGHLNAQINGF